MTIAIYAGSFDPPTIGHLNIIERASAVFDEVIVAIGVNSSKKPLFDLNERKEMLSKALIQRPVFETRTVWIMSFEGLLITFCLQQRAKVLVRGLRAATDFDYELGIAQANATQTREVQTLFLATEPKYSFVSSSTVKELAKHGGNVRDFVDPAVEIALYKKFGLDHMGHAIG